MLNVEPSSLSFLQTYNTEFDEVIITFTDENSRSSLIEDKVNLTLLIETVRYSIELRMKKHVKGYGFLSFERNLSNKYGKKLLDTGLDT